MATINLNITFGQEKPAQVAIRWGTNQPYELFNYSQNPDTYSITEETPNSESHSVIVEFIDHNGDGYTDFTMTDNGTEDFGDFYTDDMGTYGRKRVIIHKAFRRSWGSPDNETILISVDLVNQDPPAPEPENYTISLSSNNCNGGAVKFEGDSIYECSKTRTVYDYEIPINIYANELSENYMFMGWYYGSDSEYAGEYISGDNPYELAVYGDEDIEARFQYEQPQITECITVYPNNSSYGEVNVDNGVWSDQTEQYCFDPTIVDPGDYITLQARAKTGYYFIGWYASNVLYGTDTTINVQLMENSIEARFSDTAPVEYTITASSNTCNYGEVKIDSVDYACTESVTARENMEKMLWARAKNGGIFDGWYYNGTKVSSQIYYIVTFNANKSYEARFTYSSFPGVGKYFSIDNDDRFPMYFTGESTMKYRNDCSSSWIEKTYNYNSSTNKVTITNWLEFTFNSGNNTLTWEGYVWKQRNLDPCVNYYTLTVRGALNQGKISTSSDGSTWIEPVVAETFDNVPENTVVYVKAVPETGYSFVKWSDDNTNIQRQIEVISNTTLTAVFERNVTVEKHIYLCDNSGAKLKEMTLSNGVWTATGLFANRYYSVRVTLIEDGVTVYEDAWFKFYTKQNDNNVYVGAGDNQGYTDSGVYIAIDNILKVFSLVEDTDSGYYKVTYTSETNLTASEVNALIDEATEDFVDIQTLDSMSYVTRTALQNNYWNKSEIAAMSYITMTDVQSLGYLTQNDIDNMSYITMTDVEACGYATESYVMEKIAEIPAGDTSDCVKYEDLNAYSYVSSSVLSAMSYVDQTSLSSMSYITMTDVQSLGYLTQSDISSMSYVDQTSLSSMSYITMTDVQSLGYLTQSDISSMSYVDQTSLSSMSYVNSTELSNMAYVDNSYLSSYMNAVVGDINSILQTI